MTTVRKVYTFTQEYDRIGINNEVFEMRFFITLEHNGQDGYTQIRIEPSVGLVKNLRYRDVGITWGSVFYAYRWCAQVTYKTFWAWAEMDFKSAEKCGFPVLDGMQVIPEQELSTGFKAFTDA